MDGPRGPTATPPPFMKHTLSVRSSLQGPPGSEGPPGVCRAEQNSQTAVLFPVVVKGALSSSPTRGCLALWAMGRERTPVWTTHWVCDLWARWAPQICYHNCVACVHFTSSRSLGFPTCRWEETHSGSCAGWEAPLGCSQLGQALPPPPGGHWLCPLAS